MRPVTKYQNVELVSRGQFPSLVLRGVRDGRNHVRETPVQALGDRMELFGLDSAEDALELLGTASKAPEEYSQQLDLVAEAYRKAVSTEAYTVLDEVERTGRPFTARTLQARSVGAQPRMSFSVGAASSEQLSNLENRRDRALSSMHMSRYDRAPRMLASASKASPIAQALELDEDQVPELLRLTDSVSHLISGFRVQTAIDHVPEVAKAMKLMSHGQ